jgi:IQ calmodulin-binding motif
MLVGLRRNHAALRIQTCFRCYRKRKAFQRMRRLAVRLQLGMSPSPISTPLTLPLFWLSFLAFASLLPLSPLFCLSLLSFASLSSVLPLSLLAFASLSPRFCLSLSSLLSLSLSLSFASLSLSLSLFCLSLSVASLIPLFCLSYPSLLPLLSLSFASLIPLFCLSLSLFSLFSLSFSLFSLFPSNIQHSAIQSSQAKKQLSIYKFEKACITLQTFIRACFARSKLYRKRRYIVMLQVIISYSLISSFSLPFLFLFASFSLPFILLVSYSCTHEETHFCRLSLAIVSIFPIFSPALLLFLSTLYSH